MYAITTTTALSPLYYNGIIEEKRLHRLVEI
jgi:hypothetical protein